MELVLGSLHLTEPGGATTYLITVAEHLQRLGHGVTIYTERAGEMADRARMIGLRVATRPGELPDACDALLSGDGPIAYSLADHYRSTPQAYVCHSAELDVDLPPQLPGTVATVIVMNDRTQARAAAMGADAEIVRLRQPIDFERFRPARPPRVEPRLAVLLGNYLKGARRDLITEALERAGLEWVQLGRQQEISLTPEHVLADADILIGYGRSALEGMSAGCAVYVYEVTGDGWVTADSYPALEADGFGGLAFGEPIDGERVSRDLSLYDARMGVVNRELVSKHHSPFAHAAALATALGQMAGPPVERDPMLAELGRLARVQWGVQLRAWELGTEANRAHDRADGFLDRMWTAERNLTAFKHTRRYRLAQLLGAPLDLLRGRRGR
jgi:hypothetical protein